MRSIKDIATKPSEAVDFMIKGLNKQLRRRKFRLDMSVFGDYIEDEDICCGCAATCAIQQMANKNLSRRQIVDVEKRANFLKVGKMELTKFEHAIDALRKSYLGSLLFFYGLDYTDVGKEILSWKTSNFSIDDLELNNIEDVIIKLSNFEIIRDKLIELGI